MFYYFSLQEIVRQKQGDGSVQRRRKGAGVVRRNLAALSSPQPVCQWVVLNTLQNPSLTFSPS